MTDLVFLDTETTGLDPSRHEVWELAYAVGEYGPLFGGVVYHSLRNADPFALKLNGYHERTSLGRYSDVELSAREALKGNVLVGANPAFDAAFLRARWGVTPWHYRMLDVESYAMPILGFDRPKGLKDIYLDLTSRGVELPENDHSAAGDVATLREAYYALASLKRQALV